MTAIILALAEEGRPLGVGEVAEAAGLPQATVHRLLNALLAPGWVEKDPLTTHYRLGHGLLGPAAVTLSNSPLVERAQPMLNQVVEAAGAGAISLVAVLVGRTVVFLARSGTERDRSTLLPGLSRPAHCSASGKVLLAFLSAEERHRLYRGKKQLRQFTPNTITDVDTLEAQLNTVRAKGYAVEDGEYREYMRAVAVPVHGADGHVIAAIACSGRVELMTADHLAFIREEMTLLAEDLSQQAGFRE